MSIDWTRQTRRAVGLLWLVVLVALLAPVVVSHIAPRTGRSIFIIRGASMTPTIPLGSLIAVAPVDPKAIAVGDVITVKGANKVVYTHRVVAINNAIDEPRFVLKGDANDAPDGGLAEVRHIVGRVESFAPVLGYLLALLSTPSGVISAMSMLGCLLLSYWLLEDLEREEATDTDIEPEPQTTPAPA